MMIFRRGGTDTVYSNPEEALLVAQAEAIKARIEKAEQARVFARREQDCVENGGHVWQGGVSLYQRCLACGSLKQVRYFWHEDALAEKKKPAKPKRAPQAAKRPRSAP